MLSSIYIFFIIVLGLFIGTTIRLSIYGFNKKLLVFLSAITPFILFIVHMKLICEFFIKGKPIRALKLLISIISTYPIWVTVIGEITAEIISQRIANSNVRNVVKTKTSPSFSIGFFYWSLLLNMTKKLSNLIFKTYNKGVNLHTI